MKDRNYQNNTIFALSDFENGIIPNHETIDFGSTWWSKDWIEVLEYLDVDNRVKKGKTLARNGNILSLSITNDGQITGIVRDGKVNSYKVTIEIEPITENQWNVLLEKLSEDNELIAELSANNLPVKIKSYFNDDTFQLIPRRTGEIKAACNCSDWATSCKHVCALYFLLSEFFEQDPFLLFQLRGKSKSEILTILSEK
ncbi:MAG: hypothetical protein U9O98_06015, partial [Asgard group archaeon]|nr:hypothetical protein [Asgard group archaeon]